MEKSLLKNNIFAFYITSKENEAKGYHSDMTFGYYDKSKIQGEITWYPITFKYMYGIKLDDIKIAGKSTGVCNGNSECLLTIDSGTSYMSIPSYASKMLTKQGIPLYDKNTKCTSMKQYGDITFTIGGKDYPIPMEDWLFPELDASSSQS